ncbi:hypothetical protein GINT2_001140 [Glugoides intestinalis]
MFQNFELVRYPFKVKKEADVILFRVENSFEMRFSRDLFAAKVCSTPLNNSSKTFIEIEINGKEVMIVSETKRIHDFKTPADFYVPISNDTKAFYEKIHSSIIGNDVDNLLNTGIEITESISEHGFPELPLPLTTASSHFENYETAIGKLENFPKIPIIQIKHGDEIPESFPTQAMDLLKNHLTAEQFEAQEFFYERFFQVTPIARFKTVAMEFEVADTCFKRKISLNILKRCIGLHAYFVISGPWRKCWIRFGCDPRLDQSNYRYQSIEMRSKRANFQIFQKPEIVTEVMKNKEWYLLSECDAVDGFVSKALKNFIIYTIDNVGIDKIDRKIGELHDSDFEMFDM